MIWQNSKILLHRATLLTEKVTKQVPGYGYTKILLEKRKGKSSWLLSFAPRKARLYHAEKTI
jgi:hypothetical protein